MLNVIVLGADTFQLDLIKYLTYEGYSVHVVSNREVPDDISIEKLHNFSYQELEQIESLIKEYDIKQIFSVASEAGLKIQSIIQERFFFPIFSIDYVNFFQTKSLYKAKLSLLLPQNTPAFETNYLKAAEFIHKYPFVIYKPQEGSGSLNVKIIKSADEIQNIDFFIIEEFVKGQEYGGDFIVYKSELAFFLTTEKKTNIFHVPYLHLAVKNQKIRNVIECFIKNLIENLKLRDGIYNMDVILKNNVVKLIDISPRIGGNCIPNLSLYCYNVNEWIIFKNMLFNEEITIDIQENDRFYGSFIIGATKKGKIKKINEIPPSLKNHIHEIYFRVKPNDQVDIFSSGNKHIGYIIFFASSENNLRRISELIENYTWISLE